MKNLVIGFVVACALAFALFGGLGLVAVGGLAFVGKAAGGSYADEAVTFQQIEDNHRQMFRDHMNNVTGLLIPIVTVAVMLVGLALAKVPGLLSEYFVW